MKYRFSFLLIMVLIALISINAKEKKSIIVITDCYHPYQDPGDNLDLIQGFALPSVDLKAVILDVSNPFRKDTADHPMLWKDPYGPREPGIIQMEQLNYIFKRRVPYAFGPFEMMRDESDKMLYISGFEQSGVELLLSTLQSTPEPIEILSFGSARVLAVAYNRNPTLLRHKIKQIHLCAGTAKMKGAEAFDVDKKITSSVEWNVALDVFAFTRLLRSDLPIAIYPCAGKNGVFNLDENSSYWHLKDMNFLKKMHPQLQAYLDYSFSRSSRIDFINAMNDGAVYKNGKQLPFEEFHVWETAVWQQVLNQKIVKKADGNYQIKYKNQIEKKDHVLLSELRPCKLTVYNDGNFTFEYTKDSSNFSIYYRENLDEYEVAMNVLIPQLYINLLF